VFSRSRAKVARAATPTTSPTPEIGRDRAILERLAEGDGEALRDAYADHGGVVFGTAVRLLGDHQLAEECTQDVFMTLWHNAASIDLHRAKLTTWLYVVARNRAIALDRSRRARPALPFAEVPDVDHAPDPAELVQRGDDARQIIDALAELPDDQRLVVTLAYFEGLSQADIATRLDLPLGTVKGRARLALDRMRIALDRSALNLGDLG
jgi:RNA polymerase sigma-70 factor (ECF subfamily)